MQRLSLLLFSFSLSTFLTAQVLNGKIINGLGEDGLPNVRVEVSGFATTFSDQELGTFSLNLPGLRPGMKVPLDIRKEGYAVINREATQPYLPDNPLDRVKIHLALADQRDELALQFYKISVKRNIQVNFDEVAKRLAEETNYEAIAKLHGDKERAIKMSDSLAARLSRFDPQYASEELIQAMQLYQKGKINEALAILDVDKILLRIEQRKRIAAQIEKANQQDIKSLIKAAEMALTQLDFEKAQKYYEAAVLTDSSDLDNLRILCTYLFYQDPGTILIQYGEMMKRAAIRRNKDKELSIALNFIGMGLRNQNQHNTAISYDEQALNIQRRLSLKYPKYLEPNVAKTLLNLANSYAALNRHQDAISHYKEALAIQRRLSQENPQRFEPDLAMTLNNLGAIYHHLNQSADELSAFEEALAIYRRFSKENPESYESFVANTLSNLGIIYESRNRYDDAISAYQEALGIQRRLSLKNPQRFESEEANTLNSLGIMYRNLGRYDDALLSHQKALTVRRRLSQENPRRFEPDVANSLNSLGVVYRTLNRYNDALLSYEEAREIFQRLSQENRQRFEPEVGKTLNNLGNTYQSMKRYSDAISFYEEALVIRKRLFQENPQRFGLNLANTLNNLAGTFTKLHRSSDAISAFEQAVEIYRQLAKKNPKRYEPYVAMVSLNILELTRKTFLYNPSPDLVTKGKHFLSVADSSLSHSPKLPFVTQMSEIADFHRHFYYSVDWKEMSQIVPSHALKDSITDQESLSTKISLQQELISIYERALKQYPEGPSLTDSLSVSLDSLAKWQLFQQDFTGADASARKCLEVNQSYVPIYRWQAPTFLFQGRSSEAKTLYAKWKDQPWPGKEAETFKEVFLSDLERLKAQGITHPDIEKIQELLKE